MNRGRGEGRRGLDVAISRRSRRKSAAQPIWRGRGMMKRREEKNKYGRRKKGPSSRGEERRAAPPDRASPPPSLGSDGRDENVMVAVTERWKGWMEDDDHY